MATRNALLLQGVSNGADRPKRVADQIEELQCWSDFKVVGQLSVSEINASQPLVQALQKFGNVDLVLLESFDIVKRRLNLIADFLDFRIPSACLDEVMEQLYVPSSSRSFDPTNYEDRIAAAEFVALNSEEVENNTGLTRHRLDSAIQGHLANSAKINDAEVRNREIYDEVISIVSSRRAVGLKGIAAELHKQGYSATEKGRGKQVAFSESALYRIAEYVGGKEAFMRLRKQARARYKGGRKNNG